MDDEKFRQAFIRNHSLLVRKLTTDDVLPECFAQGLILLEEKQEIEAVVDRLTVSKGVERLLTVLHRRFFGKRDIFSQLFRVLEELNEEGSGYMNHIITALRNSSQEPLTRERKQGLLGEKERMTLKANEPLILSTLDVDLILPELVSAMVVSVEESELVRSDANVTERTRRLVQFLYARGSYEFHQFLSVLAENEQYQQLAERLKAGATPTTDDKHYVDMVLKRGHIPPAPRNLVHRELLVKQVCTNLYQLRDSDGWVVIHGPPGFGKTVLAIDAVSDATLLRDVFPGGVFWLSIGKMSDSSGKIKSAELLEKVQNFIARMDEKRFRPPNLESATDYLQEVMMEQYPQSLLILDNVWEVETSEVFAVRCRTLVTTRNAEVASSFNIPDVYPVPVTEGLCEEEGLQLISLSTRISVNRLPNEAADIVELCHGLPMTLDIIGAMLQHNPTEPRWKAVIQRLQRKRAGSLSSPSTLKRRALGDGRGRLEESLNASIALTEESLPEKTKDYFHQLVVFDYDSIIPTKALATIWDIQEFSTEEIMLEIVSWSLAQQVQHQQAEQEFYSFTVNNVILEYLKTTITMEDQKSYHKTVVDRYLDQAGGIWSNLVCDGYCHRKLMFHIAAAGNGDILGELLTDLRWVAACCRCWDANSLLASYTTFKNDVPKNLLPDLEQYQMFISSHLNFLTCDASTESVVQLALAQSHFEVVATQAEIVARDEPALFWLKNNAPDLQLPAHQLTPHKGDVKQCHYFDNGSKVVSCSPSNVKLWEAKTGVVLATFSGHTNLITDCAISESGEVLVSCSEDYTCKVWDVKKRSVLVNFNKHLAGVQSCDMTRSGRLVVSGDLASCIMLWESRSGSVLFNWTHSQLGITSVAFSPLGDYVAVGSQDGFVTLTTIHGDARRSVSLAITPSPLETFTAPSLFRDSSQAVIQNHLVSKDSPVYSCVFSSDGEMVAAASRDQARIWRAKDGVCTHAFTNEKDGEFVMSVEFSPDMKQLIIGCVNGTVRVWSLEGSPAVMDIPLHWDGVSCIRYSPQQTHILSVGYSNGLIKIIPSNSLQQPMKLYRRRFSVHFSKEDTAEEYSPTILCYDMRSRKLEVCEGMHGSTKHCLTTPSGLRPRSWLISPDGRLVVVGYVEGTLQVMELQTANNCWIEESAHTSEVVHCFFSPDGSRIISCGKDEYHKVWSVDKGKILSSQSDCVDFGVCPCVFYNDSNRVASTQSGKVLVWDSSSNSELFSCEGISANPKESILCVGISEDNRRLVASAANGSVAVWCANSGQLLYTGFHGNDSARSCALNRNGSLVAVGHDDCTLKIYYVDEKTRKPVTKTNNSLAMVWMVDTQFSPDDSQIITLSDSIQWWSTSGECQKKLFLKSTFGKYVHFSPDFKTFVTIDNSGLLYVLTTLKTLPN